MNKQQSGSAHVRQSQSTRRHCEARSKFEFGRHVTSRIWQFDRFLANRRSAVLEGEVA